TDKARAASIHTSSRPHARPPTRPPASSLADHKHRREHFAKTRHVMSPDFADKIKPTAANINRAALCQRTKNEVGRENDACWV
ncbi:unnamed protein product, partial [Lampetra fluviatilis]